MMVMTLIYNSEIGYRFWATLSISPYQDRQTLHSQVS
jgi:hypothetical protein